MASVMRTGQIGPRTVGRLSMYRRILAELAAQGAQTVFSHELAARAGVTAAQVRRDVMSIGFTGSPVRGYEIADLMNRIGERLDDPSGQRAALVGVGHLGQAILAYFAGRWPHLSITAGFDVDPHKVNRVIHGCRCYPSEELARVVAEQQIGIGIIAVPAGAAQGVADSLVRAGVRGLLNFAPVRLRVPVDVYVEDVDISVSLEKVAFFARQRQMPKESPT